MSHTPGPWKVEPDYDIVSTVDLLTATHVIASVSKINPCRNADARLIAAAPELLAALKMQVNYRMRDGSPCACSAGTDEDEPTGKMPTIHSTACAELRAALAHAEGRG